MQVLLEKNSQDKKNFSFNEIFRRKTIFCEKKTKIGTKGYILVWESLCLKEIK